MADTQEIKLWEWCKTHGDYAGYLMQYPNGSFAAEAKAMMNRGNPSTTHQTFISEDTELEYLAYQMRNKEEIELNEAEAFRNCRTLKDFEAFVKKYPNGEFTDKAWVVIGKLRTATQPIAQPHLSNNTAQSNSSNQVRVNAYEEVEFNKCKSIADYEKFIQKYPHSKFKELAKARIEKLKADQQAWLKKRNDEEDLEKCKTIEDYQRFIETHPGSQSIKAAQNNIGALEVEPKQLTVLLICNVLSIAAIIIGLAINKVRYIGIALLILGIVEMIAYFVVPEKKRQFVKGQTYLILSGLVSIIGGFVYLVC